jgi:hypothetical protein
MIRLNTPYQIKEEAFSKICYCNSETITHCDFKDTYKCPRVCNLFNGESEGLEVMFTGSNQWREDEK